MFRAIGLGLVLLALWLLMSGIYQPLIIGLGLFSVLLVVWISYRMDLIEREGMPFHLIVHMPAYWAWLVKEIVLANIHVARLILDPKLPISPSMIEVKATQDSDLGRVIHANSITLTPGTVSVELEGDVILVHAISQEAAEGTLEGGIDRRVTAL